MFTDTRSKKVILAAHCILNQNSKIDRCAYYPGAMRELTLALLNAGIGIIQLPCPELLVLGLDRRVDKNLSTTIKSEDNRVADLMNEPASHALCGTIATEVVYQIKEYQNNKFEVLGILGINGSPTCGVESAWANGCETADNGIFIKKINELCRLEGINIPIRGVRARDPHTALTTLEEILCQTR